MEGLEALKEELEGMFRRGSREEGVQGEEIHRQWEAQTVVDERLLAL